MPKLDFSRNKNPGHPEDATDAAILRKDEYTSRTSPRGVLGKAVQKVLLEQQEALDTFVDDLSSVVCQVHGSKFDYTRSCLGAECTKEIPHVTKLEIVSQAPGYQVVKTTAGERVVLCLTLVSLKALLHGNAQPLVELRHAAAQLAGMIPVSGNYVYQSMYATAQVLEGRRMGVVVRMDRVEVPVPEEAAIVVPAAAAPVVAVVPAAVAITDERDDLRKAISCHSLFKTLEGTADVDSDAAASLAARMRDVDFMKLVAYGEEVYALKGLLTFSRLVEQAISRALPKRDNPLDKFSAAIKAARREGARQLLVARVMCCHQLKVGGDKDALLLITFRNKIPTSSLQKICKNIKGVTDFVAALQDINSISCIGSNNDPNGGWSKKIFSRRIPVQLDQECYDVWIKDAILQNLDEMLQCDQAAKTSVWEDVLEQSYQPGHDPDSYPLMPIGDLLGPASHALAFPNGAELGPASHASAFPNGAELGPPSHALAFPNGAELGPPSHALAFPNGAELGPPSHALAFPNGAELGPPSHALAFPNGAELGPPSHALAFPNGAELGPDSYPRPGIGVLSGTYSHECCINSDGEDESSTDNCDRQSSGVMSVITTHYTSSLICTGVPRSQVQHRRASNVSHDSTSGATEVTSSDESEIIESTCGNVVDATQHYSHSMRACQAGQLLQSDPGAAPSRHNSTACVPRSMGAATVLDECSLDCIALISHKVPVTAKAQCNSDTVAQVPMTKKDDATQQADECQLPLKVDKKSKKGFGMGWLSMAAKPFKIVSFAIGTAVHVVQRPFKAYGQPADSHAVLDSMQEGDPAACSLCACPRVAA